jgi:Ser/Thr protein kinase RdoA (MazF antagonist)
MTENDALRVAARVGVAGVAARELDGGWVNDNWLVDTQASGERFVVRRHGRMHVTRRAVFFEHAVMRHAGARLPEVHAPLADGEGETILLDGGAFHAVFPYVDGMTGERAAAPAAAETLARFHLALTDFHVARPRVTRTVGVLAWLRDRLLRLAAQPVLARRLPWDEVAVALARSLTRVLPYAGKLPLATVHGDPHPDNFVVAAERVAGLLDFDFCHETERAFDVGSGMDAFARAGEDAELESEAALDFARAYHAAAPLNEAEWALLPDFMLRRNAFLVWYVVSRHGQRAFGDIGNADRYARRVLALDKLARTWKESP